MGIYCGSCRKTVPAPPSFTEKDIEFWEVHFGAWKCEECFNSEINMYENQPDNGAIMDNYGNFQR